MLCDIVLWESDSICSHFPLLHILNFLKLAMKIDLVIIFRNANTPILFQLGGRRWFRIEQFFYLSHCEVGKFSPFPPVNNFNNGSVVDTWGLEGDDFFAPVGEKKPLWISQG